MINGLFRMLFWFLAAVGRPIGGFKPRRIINWLARRGFSWNEIREKKMYQLKTAWGGSIVGHPLYHIDREIIILGCYDKPLHNLLNQYIKPGMIIFDVGANIGEVCIHAAKLTENSGLIYAFEPVPYLLERLKRNIDLNQVGSIIKVNEIALSDSNEKKLFAIATQEKENQGMGSLVNRNNKVVSEEIWVACNKLDDFVEDKKISHIDLIKIDIQGGEIGFIEGGRNTLMGMRPDLIVEVSETDLKCLNKSPKDLLKMLENLEYKIYLLGKNGVTKKRVDSSNYQHVGLSLNVFCTKNSL